MPVSHVKVTGFENPYNDETGMNDVVYSVKHIRVYKNSENGTTIPNEVYTPSNGATCGVDMVIGTEYLLSGTREPDLSLHVYLCGQVSDEGYGGVTEWADISAALRSNLTLFQC
ncbi:unnamed protein product [Heligmosomoides polygyrus]|uniref:NTR domain-containing protein n=1 Tax=Heligmosomoides polygyrus TaxID=6339 RepID=A0A183GC82_HELPZ|nr:unnamed protein product [Heligmosomoides polygyrus]